MAEEFAGQGRSVNSSSKKNMGADKGNPFGGSWTDVKLSVLAGYLQAYTTALKRTSFKLGYIDAFAGSGYREDRGDQCSPLLDINLPFPDLAASEPQKLLDGSARIALKTQPRFDRYVFIEKSVSRCRHLEDLKVEFPDLAKDIQIKPGDANKEIRKICGANWKKHRAVLLLDPYGLQVEWATIEAVAKTKGIDLWLLFPLGMGVNRLLPKSGKIPESWKNRLSLLLGSDDWYDEFYKVKETQTLFGEPEEKVIKATQKSIGRYFVKRLKTIFPAVADEPGVLRNSTNSPLFLFCFAAGNPKGGKIGLEIANHLLKELR